MSAKQASGTLALVGGGEWTDGCRPLDAALLEASGADTVVVVPTAAAVMNAVNHALGTSLSELPATPEKILAALNPGDEGGR